MSDKKGSWFSQANSLAMSADALLRSVPKKFQVILIVLTVLAMVLQSIPNVPKEAAHISSEQKYELIGGQDYADMYAARVTAHDVWDMYTRKETNQTPEEAKKWTKDESAPYPPAMIFALTGIYLVGEYTGLGFYKVVALLTCLFFALSIAYFLKTRWYLFPVLYLNFFYLGYRFFASQNTSYIVMLTVVVIALFIARWKKDASHHLVALATVMKFSPIFYITEIPKMKWWNAAIFIAILIAGLVLPYFIWDNYLYIYTYNSGRGDLSATTIAFLISGLFALLLLYIQTRMGFDVEDRIGWSLIPFGMFFMLKIEMFRQLMFVCLVPDKRGFRNIVAGGVMWMDLLFELEKTYDYTQWAFIILFFGVLGYYAWRIGPKTLEKDILHPVQAIKAMVLGK